MAMVSDSVLSQLTTANMTVGRIFENFFIFVCQNHWFVKVNLVVNFLNLFFKHTLMKKLHSILWYKTVVYYGIIPWYFGTGKLW